MMDQPSPLLASPADKNPLTRPLRRGDLVRVSETGIQKAKRFKDRDGSLGRVIKVHEDTDMRGFTNYRYDVEWILDTGKLHGCDREDLRYTTADAEGLTQEVRRRNKRKPAEFMQEVMAVESAKKQRKADKEQKSKATAAGAGSSAKKSIAAKISATAPKKTPKVGTAKKASNKTKASSTTKKKSATKKAPANSKKRKTVDSEPVAEPPAPTAATTTSGFDLYERQRREFERIFVRMEEKVDCFRHFWEDAPPEFEEKYDEDDTPIENGDTETTNSLPAAAVAATITTSDASAFEPVAARNDGADAGKDHPSAIQAAVKPICKSDGDHPYPSHAPYNWEMIRRRMKHGRYVLDRRKSEEDERFELLGSYYKSLGEKQPRRQFRNGKKAAETETNHRVLQTKGVDWELFRDDVYAMVDAALLRPLPEDEEDDGQKGSLSYAARKAKEAVLQSMERTGKRHKMEMDFADDQHKFALAVRKANTEAAMQSWRKVPFPERKYEPLSSDVVCAGLSKVDEEIASYELKTSLPDSFVGQAYRYDDTGQSEAWMKSVVDETGSSKTTKKGKKKDAADQKVEEKRQAALALSADEGVTRAQVTATMQSLLISVQDKVMTEKNVLHEPELRSANWFSDNANHAASSSVCDKEKSEHQPTEHEDSTAAKLEPEIVEQPVWGMDCYTRCNILSCLEIEFDPATALLFIEKWLLPAINACPENLAHNISNAARILEGLPFEDLRNENGSQEDGANSFGERAMEKWRNSLLGSALLKKIKASGPPWLSAAANQLRRARAALGPDFFRVHPKGNGSVVLSSTLKANTLVTFYRGELYPSWRWGEKMDAIEITQNRKNLKPALPDFYNMALERPQLDPRGYGLLLVDASRKAGHGSSLSHSCDPTCEVRVAACKGELCLAMTTLRELEMGEELTFDYNAVTESLNEYHSAVCLCGHGRCRGSFLHFATADCYQQVLNRNSPIATRFASLVKGSMKKIMSPDDEQILKSHGFLTAAFGAIGVNRRKTVGDGHSESLVDSLDMIPVWLRTYIADTLRYIEYERRALPISLICDHLASSKEEEDDVDDDNDVPSQLTKEPRLEPAFFYFSRTESDFIKGLLRKQGFPEILNGLQLKHTMQKVASSYWYALSDENKQVWKDKARANYERKLKAWRAAHKKQSKPGKKNERAKRKPAIDDILHASNISFHDADAEGVAAMEQRIQQLTQSLSRVGRVLDRHREASYDFAEDPSTLQDRVASPLRILSDEEVVGWMWNSRDGIIPALIRSAEGSRCVRPQLLQVFADVRKQFVALEAFPDPLTGLSNAAMKIDSAAVPRDGRGQLTLALLKFRSAIQDELKEMAKEFRQFRQTKKQNAEESSSQPASGLNSEDDADLSDGEENVEDGHSEPRQYGCEPSQVSADIFPSTTSAFTTFASAALTNETDGEKKGDAASSDNEKAPVQTSPWREFYGERMVLHAVADLLVLYAHTQNFFVLTPYRPLQSTPIEVYARELGNSVPRSVIDVGVQEDCGEPTTVAVGLTPVKEAPALSLNDSVERKSNSIALCEPDDIVAKVSVRYQGDYVLSQLLQWYNAGIGQKPGLPDLLGCTLLPSMSDCWSSELLQKTKLAPERRTTYETKVRPSLVEWMQDPYQRGNPWPKEIRKAFTGKGSTSMQQDTSNLFLPFGSPVIDFLVSGDESNIAEALNALDAEDKIAAKKSGQGLLSSVDKGRPAQAVSTWVQCEHPKCNKWRKIPWHVDPDLLPEKFYCSDNKWNPDANTCEAPEDDWDEADTLVGADGKVEGSPVKKREEESLSVLDESSFTIGTRFDVQRSKKNKFTVATVKLVDFSGSVKRILFHFAKTSSERDEWVEFGSPRIAPLYSKVPKKTPKQGSSSSSTKTAPVILDSKPPKNSPKESSESKKKRNSKALKKKKEKHKQSIESKKNVDLKVPKKASTDSSASDQNTAAAATTTTTAPEEQGTISMSFGVSAEQPQKNEKPADMKMFSKKKPLTEKASKPAHMTKASPVDPLDRNSFTVGARFDVFRQGKEKSPRYYTAVVEKVDSSGHALRILFHYIKTAVKYDEWIEFGSSRICTYNSKVPFQEKKVRKKKPTADEEGSHPKPVKVSQASDVPTIKPDSSAASASSSRENVAESSSSLEARDRGSIFNYGANRITSDAMVIEQPRSPSGNNSAIFDLSTRTSVGGIDGRAGSTAAQNEQFQQVDRPFVEASRYRPQSSDFSAQHVQSDNWAPTRNQNYGASDFSRTNVQHTRPPSFTTYRSNPVPNSASLSNFGSQRPFTFDRSSLPPETQLPGASPAPNGSRNVALSGLDMLAAVTSHGAFANILESAPKLSNRTASVSGFPQPNVGQSYTQQNVGHSYMQQNMGHIHHAQQQGHPDAHSQRSLALLRQFGLHETKDPSFFSDRHSER